MPVSANIEGPKVLQANILLISIPPDSVVTSVASWFGVSAVLQEVLQARC